LFNELLAILFCLTVGPVSDAGFSATTQPASMSSIRTHAHNDYQHPRPLLDALDLGYTSIEADVALDDGVLYVTHDEKEITKSRTLKSLYLDPLRDRVKRNGGWIYPDRRQVILLIDLKTEAEPTYAALGELLKQYPELFTCYRNGKRIERAVTAVVSGNHPPLAVMKKEAVRYAEYDGRLLDLASPHPATLISMISDNWEKTFKWRGAGPIPAAERIKLRKIVALAHRKNRIVRFWATDVGPPADQRALWTELIEAGVDLISTDKLGDLKVFLETAKHNKKPSSLKPTG